ncbi:MAG: M20/M25/M40 family metallo-hydrolase [Bryobacterales bacterium]|nr:M20/M25/M40 family metallo-hydrolase [Bryobacterales bacterium]
MTLVLVLLPLLVAIPAALAQPADLPEQPQVRQALDYIRANHETHLDKQVQIAEIPAPTFHEAERAKFLEKEFRRLGLKNIEIDKQGNVLGWRPGKTEKAIVIAAHLDISFAVGVDTKVRKEGGRWHGPGLADDSRGLIALLAIAEALDHAKIQTNRTLLFVANVGEEGLGDLSGVKYLFKESPHRARLDSFISIDGTSPARITTGGTGVKRYRVTLKGPGGHSYGNFGRASTIHAAGRIVTRLASLEVPRAPKTTYNVGKIEGGTAINAIAETCTMEIDLRSENPGELDKLEVKMLEAVRLGVEEENGFRQATGPNRITADPKLVGLRPAGQTAHDQPLVKAAVWASKFTGHSPSLGYSSTDSNLPISLGIPAVTLGGGGRSDNAHSLDEWFEPAGAWNGPQTVLLTILAFDRM